MAMKIGLFACNMGACAKPEVSARVARAAESAGFDSLWAGEHVVLPDPQAPPSPVPPLTEMLDPTVALAFLAAHTKTVRLGTGIIILPQRNPLVLAKELASLDVLCGGRLVFGVGIGYLKPEFDALGVPFDDKGARTEEYLRAMLAVWTMEQPRFAGRFVNFSGIQARPQPRQKPHPEIVFGGHTPAAFSRAARLAKGWYGFALDAAAAKTAIAGVKAACEKQGRRVEDLEISVTPAPERERLTVDRAGAERFAALGVNRLILYSPRARDESSLLALIDEVGTNLVGKV
jgi:probable F420-dependent oxidoreductase